MTQQRSPYWIQQLIALNIITPERGAALEKARGMPIWLATLSMFGAWVASLFVLSAASTPLVIIGESGIGRGFMGIVYFAIAVMLLKTSQLFIAQMGIAISLAGQALLISAFTNFNRFDQQILMLALVSALITGGAALVRAPFAHRQLCALCCLSAIGVAFLDLATHSKFEQVLTSGSWVSVGYFVLALGLWLSRVSLWSQLRGPLQADVLRAFAYAATLLCAIGLLVLQGMAHNGLFHKAVVLNGSATLAISVISFAVMIWLTQGVAQVQRAVMLVAALAVIALTFQVPSLMAAITLMLVAFHAASPTAVAIALVTAALAVSGYYYSLTDTLLHKSIAMMTLGALLLVARWVLVKRLSPKQPLVTVNAE